LEPGSGFCENCGMITSLDSEESKPETSSDIYSGEPYDAEKEKETAQESIEADEEKAVDNSARELEADSTEQIVPVFEYPEEKEPEIETEKTEFVDNSDIYVEGSLTETTEFEEDDDEFEDEDELTQDESEQPDDDEDDESDNGYEEPDDSDDSNTESEDDGEPAEEDGLDDMYVTASKSKRNSVIIAILIVALIAVISGGAVMIKDNFSKVPVNAPAADTQSTSAPKESATTNKADSDDSETSKDVTDEETTEKETTEKEEQEVTEPSEESTTEKPSETEAKTTEKQTTTKKYTTTTKSNTTTTKIYTTTEKPSATQPVTTKPATTNPTTTKPTTTKPTTTKPATTTDPYGFGTDEVQEPDTYLAAGSRYTVYVNVNSLNMRSKPSTDSTRVVYVSLGEDLTVYGKSQNGFIYVRSNRYGVYGWVAEDYVSKTRPEADEVVVVPGIVKPDKQYSSPKTMYVNAKVGIRLRKAPDTDSESVRTLSYGFPVKVTGYSSEHSGWVYVTDITHGVTGWTRLEWLTKNQ
ncbi:MAG: SH3 domain-containing protein, partial [Acutalibacteraceae bacterium]